MTPHSELWIFRHGQTEWSMSGQHTSRTDLPLTAEGERLAKTSARLVSGKKFAMVLCSPRKRAIATCKYAGLGDQMELTEDLFEWDYGDYEGLTTVQIHEKFDKDWTVWTGVSPNGETGAQVAARADKLIARAKTAGGDVALFGHGHMLRVLTARWLGLTAAEGRLFALSTGTLSILGYERDTHVIKVWNQTPF
jgi:probable phosphoglycerate mutase